MLSSKQRRFTTQYRVEITISRQFFKYKLDSFLNHYSVAL